jgi:hypothetical protein
MSRSILVASALLWGAVAAVAVLSIASGDWLTPAVMSVAAIAFIVVRGPRRLLGAAAP